jgi:hypothetical protein
MKRQHLVRQRVAHAPHKAVDEVVLAAMRPSVYSLSKP